MHNKSIYSFGGVTDKAIKKVSKLFKSDCPEDIVYDYANLIITMDLLDRLSEVRMYKKNPEKHFERLRNKTLQAVAEFMEIEVPETPKGEWDYSLLPMFIEAVLEFGENSEDPYDDYDEEDDFEEGEEEEDSPKRRINRKLKELASRETDFESFFDEEQADANPDPEAEDVEFVDDVQRFIEEKKLGFDEKVDLAVETAMRGDFEEYFMGDESNQFARFNRHAISEMTEMGLDPVKWLQYDMEDRFILQKKEVMEFLETDEIIKRTRALAKISLGSRQDGTVGYLVPGLIKRMWGTVRHATGKTALEISTVPEARLFLNNLKLNWKQINPKMPDSKVKAQVVGKEVSRLLKQLEMSFSNREGGLLTIRAWRRNVGTDIFIGNYSHCCVGVGECNHSAIYDWLSLATTNAITVSITNRHTLNKPKPVGAIFTAAFKEDDKPVFLVDGVELDNLISFIPALEDRMKKFVRELARSVGFEEQPYYTENYVRLNFEGFEKRVVTLDMIGGFPGFEDELHFETYGGWTKDFVRPVTVYVEQNK
jgi:hypothetical protein